jgi:prephenate dehydrogenase
MFGRRRALIAGLGLIGGSIGIALRRRRWFVEYVDPYVDEATAIDLEAADARVDAIGPRADIIIVATPVDVAFDLVRGLPPGAYSMTVCSVMEPMRDLADSRGLGHAFIAGHPLAGSEKRGLAAADGDLFRGRRWFVDRVVPIVEDVVEGCGAILDRVDAADHDRAVALTSHLPQILSTALAAHLDESEADARFAGTGLKTFLRLAESDASVWMSIIGANRDHIDRHLDRVLEIVREMLHGDDRPFARARDAVRKLTTND